MCEHREGACLLDERGRLELKGCEVLAAGQNLLAWWFKNKMVCVLKNKASSIPLLSIYYISKGLLSLDVIQLLTGKNLNIVDAVTANPTTYLLLV